MCWVSALRFQGKEIKVGACLLNMGQDSSFLCFGHPFFEQCSGMNCDITLAGGQAKGKTLTKADIVETI